MTTLMSLARAAGLAAMAGAIFAAASLGAAGPERISLPAPQTDGGKPLMQALAARRTTRSFAETPLAEQTLSNLLWAAFGVNRPESGGRTAPSARNWQEIDVYVVMREGAYLYDAKAHALKRVLGEDVRALAGSQSHAREAPLTLVYVADGARMGLSGEATRTAYGWADTAFIAQNVYLFCASEGLGAVVFASIDRERLAGRLGLRPDQSITLAQSVGHPARAR